MAKVTFGFLTTAAFAAALTVGALSWPAPVSAEDEHERRIHECVDAKRHHIQEQEEHHQISHEEADRMRDHSREECEREIDGHR
jgi:hypothetical protein